MKIIVTKDYNEMSRKVAEMVAEVLVSVENPVLGLATGSTPVGAYKILADFCARKRLSFKNVRTVNLDEYVGLGRRDAQSYVSFMFDNLFDKVDLQPSNAHIPNGLATDVEGECLRYRKLLESNRQDLQILGLGSNGHIGFNEPNTPFDSTTHVVNLAQSTIEDNSRFFKDVSQVPAKAITMGIAEIMRAKKILLLASGSAKAQAVRAAVCGEVSKTCPASVLQLHPDCTVILDELAASMLDGYCRKSC